MPSLTKTKMTIKRTARRSQPLCSERGSVFFYILIGVALFGALAYSLTRSTSQVQSIDFLSQRDLELEASKIIDFSRVVEQGFQTLLTRGCSESEIASEGSHHHGGYTHPDTPADNSCQMFHPDGAGLTYYDPPDAIHQDGVSNHFRNWWFTKERVAGRGDEDCFDQTIILRNIKEPLCRAVNRIANPDFSAIPINNYASFGAGDWHLGQRRFDCTSGLVSFDRSEFAGTNTFCFDDRVGGYFYVHIIHER